MPLTLTSEARVIDQKNCGVRGSSAGVGYLFFLIHLFFGFFVDIMSVDIMPYNRSLWCGEWRPLAAIGRSVLGEYQGGLSASKSPMMILSPPELKKWMVIGQEWASDCMDGRSEGVMKVSTVMHKLFLEFFFLTILYFFTLLLVTRIKRLNACINKII